MIMYMYKRICVTNRSLVKGDFFKQLKKVAQSDADILILREKDLSEAEYEKYAVRFLDICAECGKTGILHSFINTAKRLDCDRIHLTLDAFKALSDEDRVFFSTIGVSTHAVKEAIYCEQMGASYVTASHIFETKCKEGLEPKGLSYLKDVVNQVRIPVYALGGIHPDNIDLCIEAGADGVCMMSEYMNI